MYTLATPWPIVTGLLSTALALTTMESSGQGAMRLPVATIPAASERCLSVSSWRSTLGDQELTMSNQCDNTMWYRACYNNEDGEPRKTTGYVPGNGSKTNYLIHTDATVQSSFDFNEGSDVDRISYPSACS
jgi:hypothetical protein